MSLYGELALPLQSIEVPKDNDARLVFTYQDQAGNLLDLTGTQEITFAVFDVPGGNVEIIKTLSDSDITISGNDYQFSFWINSEETAILSRRLLYHECLLVDADGRQRTVSAGTFRAENTYIGSIE
jgi:hypothetical protein